MRAVAVRPFTGVAPSETQVLSDHGVGCARKEVFSLDYTVLLRRLSLHDEQVMTEVIGGTCTQSPGLDPILDPRTLALVRLAALITVGGAVPSYGAQVDAAIEAGATAAEIVAVLVGVIPVVGQPCVVAAAPKLALALGHDVDDFVGLLPGG